MALPAHGHIIEEPEEDYCGERRKKKKKNRAGMKRTVLVIKKKKDEVRARKKNQGSGEQGSERQNMPGKCSTTCLQFIINFLEPPQSYGSGARASGAIPFHWQM